MWCFIIPKYQKVPLKWSKCVWVQDGVKPVEAAAMRGDREVVEILLPVTSPIPNISKWSVDGIIEHMQSVRTNEQVNCSFFSILWSCRPLMLHMQLNFHLRVCSCFGMDLHLLAWACLYMWCVDCVYMPILISYWLLIHC